MPARVKDWSRIIEEARGLPAVAAVVTSVMNTVVEESSAKELAAVIEKDSSVTTRMLKVINSAYYGLSGHVSTVSHAVPLLGVQVVKNIVLTFSVLDVFDQGRKDGGDIQKLWEHSFATAAASRLIARRMDYPDAEEALVAGLLHDIGVLVLVKHDIEDWRDAVREAQEKGEPLADAEQRRLGITHAEIGALLAEKWNLPEILVVPVRYHHDDALPAELSRQARRLTDIVHVADLMCRAFTLPISHEQILAFRAEARERLHLDDDILVDILKGVTSEMEAAAETFMVAPPKSYIEILEQAHLELGRLNLSYLMDQPVE
jgi:two-component system, cell cycle response regulator